MQNEYIQNTKTLSYRARALQKRIHFDAFLLHNIFHNFVLAIFPSFFIGSFAIGQRTEVNCKEKSFAKQFIRKVKNGFAGNE